MICPQCRSAECFRSRRNRTADFLCTIFGMRPWRCHSCDKRFYARRVALVFQKYAHCPRCGNFDIDPISRERVDKGAFVFWKRLLGFPAYRCDPCRERFFSVRRFHRIVPSMLCSVQSRKNSPRDIPAAGRPRTADSAEDFF